MKFILPNKGQQDKHFADIESLVTYIKDNEEQLTTPVTIYYDNTKVIIPQVLIEMPEDSLKGYLNHFFYLTVAE